MKLERRLRRRLHSGEPVSGPLVRIPSEEFVEVAAASGADFIVIDCEHGPADVVAIRQHIASAAIFGVETIVRVGSQDRNLILRVADAGASGIIVPHVDNPEEAKQCVAWATYPPAGHRGFALYSRAANYGTITAAEHLRNTEESSLLIVMLESPIAATNAADIIAVPGIDGYMIGTSDLTASTGANDRSVADSVTAIKQAGKTNGAIRFDIVNSPEHAAQALADGAQVIVYNTTALLVDMIRSMRVSLTDPS